MRGGGSRADTGGKRFVNNISSSDRKQVWKCSVLGNVSHEIPPALLVVVLVMLSGCTDTADTFPMNAAAKGLGPLRASFVRTGVGHGPVTFTMADGEILTGEYRVAFGTSTAMAFSGGRSASAMVISDGPMQFVATGPKTQILCRGSSTTMGHGNGECQTYEGALWNLSW
jgi:hypothetical protein